MKRSKKDKFESVSYICEDSVSSGESSYKDDNISQEGISKKFNNPCTNKRFIPYKCWDLIHSEHICYNSVLL